MLNIENKPCFASVLVLDRIRASPRDLNGSDPNWYGYSIRSRRVRIADPNWIRKMRSRVYARPIRSSLGTNSNGSASVYRNFEVGVYIGKPLGNDSILFFTFIFVYSIFCCIVHLILSSYFLHLC